MNDDYNYKQPLDDSWKNSANQQGNNQYPPQEYGQQAYGYDPQGFDPQGYDMEGYDRQGYDRQGYNRNGFDRNGYDRFGNPYNPYAYQQQPQYQQYQGYDNYGIEPEPHLTKAIFAIILFFPFGIPAVINASRVKGLANTDIDAAFEASNSANKWGNLGIIFGIIWLVINIMATACGGDSVAGLFDDLVI